MLCLICGCSEDEVPKMHYFPRNAERGKKWFESLGLTYPNVGLRNYRICSNHFRTDDYRANWVLKPDALPFRLGVENTGRIMNEFEEPIEEGRICEVSVEAGPSSRGQQLCVETPKPKVSVLRGVTGVSKISSTPRKQKLIKIVESKESHVWRLKKLAKTRGHSIKELSKLSDSNVVRDLFKGLPSVTANFLISQVRCSKLKPKARRWTLDEKIMALALFKRGPKCYRLLSKFVAMPSKQTLLGMLRHICFDSGINQHILNHIDESLKDDDNRLCTLLMDEMDIKEHIQYDSYADKIRGFQEIAGEPSNIMAKKALVFMVKGVKANWKQPVAYYFSHEAIKGANLSQIIVEVINACQTIAKLTIVALINDCGTPNVKALKELGASIQTPYIIVGEQKIFTIYDPPHLLKCTASLFRKHNLELEVPTCQNSVMQARFGDIRKAHQIDTDSPLVFRAMHKIKNHHMEPKMKYAMKVNLAAQILSRSVSSYLYTLVSTGHLEQRAVATATFVQQVDELFDSFNGSSKFPPTGKDIKCILTEKTPHILYWKKAYTMVKNWKYVRFNKKGGRKKSKPPSQIAWLTTIRAMEELWNYLHTEKNIDSIKPRNFNQDALENLFGGIRSGLGCNDNPTTIQFVASFKTQILNGLIYLGSGKNCEEDDGILLSNLKLFLKPDQDRQSPDELIDSTETAGTTNAKDMATDIADAVSAGAAATMSVAYVGGFIIKKILELIDCQLCKNILISDSDQPHNLFISFREWAEGQEKLIYPAEQPVVSVGIAITILENFLDSHCNMPNISARVEKELKEKIDFSWLSCPNHKEFIRDSIVKGVWKIGIPWWCKRKVLELKRDRHTIKNKKMQKFLHV